MNDKQLTPEGNKIKCPSCGIWYSDQQTAALQARVQELETEISGLYAEEIDDSYEVATLKSRIAELERERNELGSNRIAVGRRLISSQQHAEKLLGLLEKAVINKTIDYFLSRGYDHERAKRIAIDGWPDYCRENGLQSPETPLP